MGSNDVPPPNIPSHVVPISALLLQLGGGLWTVCYVLYARESFRSKSYGMPLLALCLNVAWEFVYGLLVAESFLERTVFLIWLAIDCAMVFGTWKFARFEWAHSQLVVRHMGLVIALLIGVSTMGQWAFARWWIENEVGKREGKFYRGVVGPDTTELGFWTALFNQAYLSSASLAMLVVRGHSGGVSWGIWATRTLGSILGLYAAYAWQWWFWHEAHEYVGSPFAIFMLVVSIVTDFAYALVLWKIRKYESVLTDGRKISGIFLALETKDE